MKNLVQLNRPPVEQRVSKIRRDPVRIGPAPEKRRPAPPSRERVLWGGVGGIILFAIILGIMIVGISIATLAHRGPGAAPAPRFGQCYNSAGANCVVDGDTIRIGDVTVEVAGLDAPGIDDSRCQRERERGIAAAVRLAELLGKGKVHVGPVGADGKRTVEVDGRNVKATMIDGGFAQEEGEAAAWC